MYVFDLITTIKLEHQYHVLSSHIVASFFFFFTLTVCPWGYYLRAVNTATTQKIYLDPSPCPKHDHRAPTKKNKNNSSKHELLLSMDGKFFFPQ